MNVKGDRFSACFGPLNLIFRRERAWKQGFCPFAAFNRLTQQISH